MNSPVLTTARLCLVPVTLDDADFIQAEFPHWDIVKFMNTRVPWPYPADGARQFLDDLLLPQIARGEAYAWSIRLRTAPDSRVGLINLRIGSTENRGFWIARAHQGQGFASEAADAVTEFYFNTLDQPGLRVSKAVANIPSSRLSARQGMRVIARGETDYVSGRHPSETWAITQDEWRAQNSS
ncbi:MAG: GNAT family N-acetyltransferase [Proteobacteria bacterium]|nr:GNAT family N-acetyltransferase [Pseudomonadota bacterium]